MSNLHSYRETCGSHGCLVCAGADIEAPKAKAVGMHAVYVASAFQEFKRVRVAQDRLRAAGHVVTMDWAALADVYPNDDAPKTEAKQHALADLDGVRRADVMLLLCPTDKTRGLGCFVELGYALALGKRVVIAGEKVRPSIFYELAAQRFETDEEAVDWIVGVA